VSTLHPLLLSEVIEDVALANYLEVWSHTSFLKGGYRYQSNLVYFLHSCFVRYRLLRVGPLPFKEVLEVVYVPDLAWYCDSLFVKGAHFSVVKQRFVRCPAQLSID